MANLNKVMLIGRLTRDPEVRAFSNGGKVAKFGFAVNNRRKNQNTGEWEDEAVFIDVEVFNRGEGGRQADAVEQYLTKGRQIFIEGHLRLDQWTSPEGQKRSRLLVRADRFEFLDSKIEAGATDGSNRFSKGTGSPSRGPAVPARTAENYDEPPIHEPEPAPEARGEEEIPF